VYDARFKVVLVAGFRALAVTLKRDFICFKRALASSGLTVCLRVFVIGVKVKVFRKVVIR
jgi:hypothetical protein